MAHPIVVEMTSPNNVLDSRPHYDSKKGYGTYNRAESLSLQVTTNYLHLIILIKRETPNWKGFRKI